MSEKSLFDDIIEFDEPILQDEVNLEDQNSIEEENDPDEDIIEEEVEIESDERVLALYEFMKDNNYIDEVEDFKGTPEELENLFNSLPDRYLDAAISSLPETAQELLVYAANLGDKASKDELKKFFDDFIDTPTYDLEDEEQAYEYLKSKLQGTKAFKTEEKLNAYLDSLVEDGSIGEISKEYFEEEQDSKEKAKKALIEQAEEEKKANEANAQKFYNSLYEELDSYDWKDTRKKAIKQNLDPNEANRKNMLIAQSPKALIQLADIYSRFNEKTGEFDLSDFEIKSESKKNVKKKEEFQKGSIDSVLNRITSRKSSKKEEEGFFEQFKPID